MSRCLLRRQLFASTCSTNGERKHWIRSPLLMAYSVLFTMQWMLRFMWAFKWLQPGRHVFSNACILHLRSHVHNFNSIGWLCLCPKKERAREVLKNSHFFTALTSLNNQLLPFLWKEADHCVLQATKEICLLLCFCLLLCTKKRFKMMSKHPLSTSSKLTKIWADHVQEAQKTLSFTE